MRVGYFLSSEEFGPRDLVEQARRAEQAGFHALWISDHYHPWNDEQGHSPLVWSVIGALAEATNLPVTTGVTCPTVRIHPAIIAQAAATSGVMHQGRFSLGVGSGEALNEHILGDRWPEADVSLEMLEEAVEVIRTLWQGGQQSHHGCHYSVENARVYDLPAEPPPILVSGFGPKAIDLAARIGDGFCTTSPDKDASTDTAPQAAQARCTPGPRSASWTTPTRHWKPSCACGPTKACPASSPRSCPPRRTSSRPASSSPPSTSPRPSDPTSTSTSSRSGNTPTPGSTKLFVQQIGPEQEPFFTTWADKVLPHFT